MAETLDANGGGRIRGTDGSQTSAPPKETNHNARLACISELLGSRRSCRAFLPDPVDPALLGDLLARAQRSASWCNSQSWQVIATSGVGTDRFRDALFAHAQTHPGGQATDFPFPSQYNGVYQERRRETAFQLYDSVGVARGDREASFAQTLENFRFFGAPHVLVITSECDLGPYGAVDCGIYVSSLLLLAEAAGVSAIAQAALASYPDFIRDYFGLPENRAIVCGVSIGYGDQSHPANGFRTSRAQLDDVVHWVTD